MIKLLSENAILHNVFNPLTTPLTVIRKLPATNNLPSCVSSYLTWNLWPPGSTFNPAPVLKRAFGPPLGIVGAHVKGKCSAFWKWYEDVYSLHNVRWNGCGHVIHLSRNTQEAALQSHRIPTNHAAFISFSLLLIHFISLQLELYPSVTPLGRTLIWFNFNTVWLWKKAS